MKFGIEKRRATALIRRERDVAKWQQAATTFPPPPELILKKEFEGDEKKWVAFCKEKEEMAKKEVAILQERQSNDIPNTI